MSKEAAQSLTDICLDYVHTRVARRHSHSMLAIVTGRDIRSNPLTHSPNSSRNRLPVFFFFVRISEKMQHLEEVEVAVIHTQVVAAVGNRLRLDVAPKSGGARAPPRGKKITSHLDVE